VTKNTIALYESSQLRCSIIVIQLVILSALQAETKFWCASVALSTYRFFWQCWGNMCVLWSDSKSHMIRLQLCCVM